MKAVVQVGYGAPADVLGMAEVEPPSIGAGDVLVRVRATSVNTPDLATVTGVPFVLRLRSGVRRPSAPVRGSDVAGVVEAVGGDVTGFCPGDEVFGSLWDGTLRNGGTFAELVAVPASRLAAMPAGLGFEEAAASVMSGLTALIGVRDVAGVGPGTHVLINGASGGVGTFAVQIAKELGAEVTGVCGAGNLELVRSLGADHVVDYATDDFTQRAGRFDVVFDNVMDRSLSATTRVLARGGVYVPNSLGLGNSGTLFAGLLKNVRAALMGLGSLDVRFVKCVVNRENLDALARLLESKAVKPVVAAGYSLGDAADAVGCMGTHHAGGNVVITV